MPQEKINTLMEHPTETHINSQVSAKLEYTDDGRIKRKIRSFVLRAGRLTAAQQQAIENSWKKYGLDYQMTPYDFAKIFANDHPVILEVGFGMGASLVEMAKNNPQYNYIGIEVHTPGIGACIALAQKQGIANLRVVCHDAMEILLDSVADDSLMGLQLFFPDPWHKAKHHKRRIVQPEFIQLIKQKLQINGFIHMATDWQNYAEQMLEILSQEKKFKNQAIDGTYIERPQGRPLTKFEQRGHRLGHGVWDLYFIKQED